MGEAIHLLTRIYPFDTEGEAYFFLFALCILALPFLYLSISQVLSFTRNRR
jgi:hypothetical protein